MEKAEVDRLAKIIWDYMHMGHQLKKSDVVIGMGSHDTKVAKRSAQIFLDGYADRLLFTGGVGRLTGDTFKRPEADEFAAIAVGMGVPEGKVIIENESTNSELNVRYSEKKLKELGVAHKSVILVTKPYMERRAYATFMKHWSGDDTELIMASPTLSYEEYLSDPEYKDHSINIMVGDVQRIKEYPAKGFTIPQGIPAKVWDAYEQLVVAGYDKQLIQQ